jgi:hypothetical protein
MLWTRARSLSGLLRNTRPPALMKLDAEGGLSVNTKVMSGFDAVDGSSTGTEVPWIWVLLRPP